MPHYLVQEVLHDNHVQLSVHSRARVQARRQPRLVQESVHLSVVARGKLDDDLGVWSSRSSRRRRGGGHRRGSQSRQGRDVQPRALIILVPRKSETSADSRQSTLEPQVVRERVAVETRWSRKDMSGAVRRRWVPLEVFIIAHNRLGRDGDRFERLSEAHDVVVRMEAKARPLRERSAVVRTVAQEDSTAELEVVAREPD